MKRRFPVLVVLALGLAALAGPLAILLGAGRGEASFGDSEAFGVNELSSATVALGLGPTTVPISAPLMAPGDRSTSSIELRNDGTLPLRYAVQADRSGRSLFLFEALVWEIWLSQSDERCVRSAVQPLLFGGTIESETVIGNPAVGQDDGDRVIEPEGVDLLCMSALLPIDATDRYQDAAVSVDFVILAEQAVGEP